jgi:hypothetical protein
LLGPGAGGETCELHGVSCPQHHHAVPTPSSAGAVALQALGGLQLTLGSNKNSEPSTAVLSVYMSKSHSSKSGRPGTESAYSSEQGSTSVKWAWNSQRRTRAKRQPKRATSNVEGVLARLDKQNAEVVRESLCLNPCSCACTSAQSQDGQEGRVQQLVLVTVEEKGHLSAV